MKLVINDKLKNPDIYRYAICLVAFVIMLIEAVNYVNGGVEYDHLVAFRPYCALFAIVLISLMDVKTWFNIFSLIYIPICYGVTHFMYESEAFMNKYDIYAPYYPDVKRYAKLMALCWGIFIISVIVDCIKNKGYKKLKNINPVLGISWIVFMILLAVFMNQYTYNIFIILAFSGMLYVTADSHKKEILITSLKFAFIVSFVFYLYKSLRHRPYDTERYMFYFVNSNVGGTYFACLNMTIYSLIYEWWNKEKSKQRTAMLVALLFIFGVAGTMTIFNYTRTTITGTLAAAIILFVLRIIRKESMKQVFARMGAMLLSLIILFYPVYLAMRYIPALFNEPTFMAWEYNEQYRVHKDDPMDSPKYTSIAEFLTLALGKWGIYVDFEADKEDNPDSEAVVFDSERDVTNGRTDIWKAYGGLIEIKGHYPAYIYIGHDAVYEDMGLYKYSWYDENAENDVDALIYHAHDTYLHMAYIHGLIFAICYAIMCGIVFLSSIINVIKGKGDITNDVYAFLLIGVSVFSQVTESIVHPAYILCFMMYIAFIMVIGKEKKVTD